MEKPVVGGDPIVFYNGKRTQFWTQPGQSPELIRCGAWGLHGTAFDGAERSQWFRRFEVRHEGKAVAEVSVPAGAPRASGARADVPASQQAAEVDVTVETQPLIAANAAGAAAPENTTLPSTLIAVADGQRLVRTGDRIAGAHGMNVSIAYNREYAGFRYHTATFDTEDLSFSVSSAPAGKMKSIAESVKYMHLDLKFTHLNVHECFGVLPEIWGVHPMSGGTAKMLLPPEK